MIEIIPLNDWTEVDDAVRRLHTYQWILFTSTNAVDAFMRRVELAETSCDIPVAAVGSATEARLRHWDIRATIVPGEFRAEGLLEALPRDLANIRILFPRAEQARELLPHELRRRGAVVDIVTVYRTEKSTATAASIRSIFATHRVNCIVFTSSSTVRHMAQTLGGDLPSVLANTSVAVMGPITANTAREAGLNPDIVPVRSTIADLVAAIENRFGR
jgi:uroporphyrinogen III methyltransferase/synthase